MSGILYMKRVDVIVRKEDSEAVKNILGNFDLVYTSLETKVDESKCIFYSTIVPNKTVNELMDRLSQSIDFRSRVNIISVTDIQATISPHLDRLREKARETKASPSSLESIVQPLDRYLRFNYDILAMAGIATTIAAIGLFLNNVAVIIGAMLISPLLGPINAVAANASLGRIERLLKAQLLTFILVAAVIALSFGISIVSSGFTRLGLTEQIIIRSDVTLLDVGMAVLIGAAGGLALTTGFPEILVGVAVAAALIPPATVAGIGLALLDTHIFLGALLLTIVNLLGVEAGGILSLRIKGVIPRKYFEKEVAKRHSYYSLLVLITILALLAILITAIKL